MGPSLFSAVFHHAAAADVGDEEIEQIDQQEDAERLNGRDEDMASSQLGDDAVDEDDRMIMNIIGLGSESFEKYKSNEKYFGDVKELISDSKSCIQQFANHLGTTNNKVPTTPIVKKYLTKDGKSLGGINEMMTEVAGLITKTKGIGTRYLQGYLNFNILRKRMKYKYKRDKVPEEIMDLLVETSSFKNIFVCSSPMPISLKEAYYEYRYGIFKD